MGIPLLVLSLLIAGTTAFYMFRLVVLTFYGKPRYDEKHLHPHESPATMTIPLIILAILSVIGGFIGIPEAFGFPTLLKEWLDPVLAKSTAVLLTIHNNPEPTHTVEFILVALYLIVSVIGIFLAFKIYSKKTSFDAASGLGKVLENKYYVDEAYDKVIVNPIQKTSEGFSGKYLT